jgi:metal-responsive CopG/Arc/MetJ family transcriptional regulator
LRLFRSTPPDKHAAFRLSHELLAIIDSICDQLDITRSQFFRHALTDRVKSYGQERNIQPPSNVQIAKEEEKRQWSQELYDRMQRRR